MQRLPAFRDHKLVGGRCHEDELFLPIQGIHTVAVSAMWDFSGLLRFILGGPVLDVWVGPGPGGDERGYRCSDGECRGGEYRQGRLSWMSGVLTSLT